MLGFLIPFAIALGISVKWVNYFLLLIPFFAKKFLVDEGKINNDKLFKDLEENNYINKETNSKIPQETIGLLKVQKDTIIKKLNFKPDTYYTKSSFPLSNSQNAFDLLWRMCESYELWCKEIGKEKLITLNITALN